MEREMPTTAEGRERQLIGLAADLAERKLRDGTARASTIEHFLRLGSSEYALKRQQMELQNELIHAKIRALDRQENSDELIKNAMEAIQRYSGRYGQEELYEEDL